jgi:hypothetical protein
VTFSELATPERSSESSTPSKTKLPVPVTINPLMAIAGVVTEAEPIDTSVTVT